MKKYLISYDLRWTWHNYMPFYDALKALSTKYIHFIENSWFIESELTASEIYNKLKIELFEQDQIFIVEITNVTNYSGFFVTSAWKWLKGEE
jgi:hypothetical protein